MATGGVCGGGEGGNRVCVYIEYVFVRYGSFVRDTLL